MNAKPHSSRVALLAVLMALVGLLLTATAALAQSGSLAAINTGKLNVRTGPGIIYPIVAKVDYNVEVILLGRADGTTWVQVQIPGGQQGWVNRIYLRTFADYGLLPVTWSPPATPPPILTVPPPSQPPGQQVYVVRTGDSLKDIAARFGTTWQILAAVNNIPNPNRIFPGQRLLIAFSAPPPSQPPPSQPPPASGVHIVQNGETLRTIAARYNTTWQAIASANALPNANVIYPGQRLVIPAPVVPQTYVVVAGDTLFSIATRFGTTVAALQQLNGISNPNAIAAGQTIRVR